MPGHFSQNLKDLVAAMLQKNPNDRITAQAAMDHPWFKSVQEDDDVNEEEYK